MARERRVWTQAEIEEDLKKPLDDKDIAMFERLSREWVYPRRQTRPATARKYDKNDFQPESRYCAKSADGKVGTTRPYNPFTYHSKDE